MQTHKQNKNTVSVYNLRKPNSVNIYIPKDIRDIFGTDQLVVKEQDGNIAIRGSIISDNRTLKMFNGVITYTSVDAKDLIGEYEYEVDGDYLLLENITKSMCSECNVNKSDEYSTMCEMCRKNK